MSVRVICGDSRKVVPTLGQFDFVFADPPFNIGQSYSGHNDRMDQEDHEELIWDVVESCWNACDGVMALHGPDDLAELYLIMARRLKMRRIVWVNLTYNFGQCRWDNWVDARCHCLIFSKNDTWTWNTDDVLIESARLKGGDKRVLNSPKKGMRLPGTVWGLPCDGESMGRIQGNNAERIPSCPNQLPERYLERLVRAYTNPGDRVLDPFGGSGTTAVVADALGRECVTVDVSASNCLEIERRVVKGSVRVKR